MNRKNTFHPFEVYLGGPIGDKTIEEANGWRKNTEKFLDGYGIQCLNPLRGITEENRKELADEDIIERDKNDIVKSNIVLVNWPIKCVSNGTAMEIMYAYERDIPVVLIGEWAMSDLWLRYHATEVFDYLWGGFEWIINYQNSL